MPARLLACLSVLLLQLVRSLTVCRVLVVPRPAYSALASDFPLSATAVLEALQAQGLVRPVLQLGLRDEFIEHGDPAKLLALQGLDAAGIEAAIGQRWPD